VDVLFTYTITATGRVVSFAPPRIELDGREVCLTGQFALCGPPVELRAGVREYRFAAPVERQTGLTLTLAFIIAEASPIVRFRYILESVQARTLTKTSGVDSLVYTSFSVEDSSATEIRFAEFSHVVHSFTLSEAPVEQKQFDNNEAVMGPMLVSEADWGTMLVAYEHGSQVPDAFIDFKLSPDRKVTLKANKGNYYDGQPVGPGASYCSIWLEAGAVLGGQDDMADAYRDFVLRWMCPNTESRKPYIFYNTWAYQERNRWYNGQKFLTSMHQERMLAEIDAAHEMGVDVFVLDTGWYEKTGDWRVNLERFPDGLASVKAKLDEYGMKLGLWFDPLAAADTSSMCLNHLDCRITRNGDEPTAHEIWETQASYRMCLVSRYADAFADELIRLVREVGVTYFKWDGIHQYGCSDPGHNHGTAAATEKERLDSYAFQMGPAMSAVVDRLCAACPEAIVDFDVTEGGRYVGLGFLASGKYFLVNNGPYFQNYDMRSLDRKTSLDQVWSNIFVHPGPARAWICRTPLTFDKWIPSVLFLTHYLPDDPETSQWINIASLVLGQNGIWGDLLDVSDDGKHRFGEALDAYKSVRDDVTTATLKLTGKVSGTPEVYEKINPATGRGLVSIFASSGSNCRYITQASVAAGAIWASPGAHVRQDDAGRAIIDASFDGAGAKLIMFR